LRRPFSNCLAYESASLTNIDSVISELIYTVQYDDQAVSRFRSLRATSRFDTFSRLTGTVRGGGYYTFTFRDEFHKRFRNIIRDNSNGPPLCHARMFDRQRSDGFTYIFAIYHYRRIT